MNLTEPKAALLGNFINPNDAFCKSERVINDVRRRILKKLFATLQKNGAKQIKTKKTQIQASNQK